MEYRHKIHKNRLGKVSASAHIKILEAIPEGHTMIPDIVAPWRRRFIPSFHSAYFPCAIKDYCSSTVEPLYSSLVAFSTRLEDQDANKDCWRFMRHVVKGTDKMSSGFQPWPRQFLSHNEMLPKQGAKDKAKETETH